MAKHRELLDQLPSDAWPEDGKHGEWNWTIRIGGATIQVLAKKLCFYITKATTSKVVDSSPTVSWSQHADIRAAWEFAKQTAGIV